MYLTVIKAKLIMARKRFERLSSLRLVFPSVIFKKKKNIIIPSSDSSSSSSFVHKVCNFTNFHSFHKQQLNEQNIE